MGEKCNACRLNDTWVGGRCVNCGYDEGALAGFLSSRIAEDESDARLVATLGFDPHVLPGPHHPDRVLAECEAKRRIVEVFDAYRFEHDTDHDAGFIAYREVCQSLALPYADHPDYRRVVGETV